MNIDISKKLTLIEAFGGIGTFRKALENLGFKVETREYIEWWKYAVDAYNSLHNNNQIAKDIKNYDWTVDIFAHGSPCTDFSLAGAQDITKGRSILYMEVLRLIEDLPLKIRPKYIIWENVKNLVSKKFKPYFDYYINKLTELGYKSTWKVLNSKDFGIPQSRERVFVISIRNDENTDFDWSNLITKKPQSLTKFLHKLEDTDTKLWFTKDKLQKAIDKGYYKTTEWKFNNNRFCYLPLSSRNSDNKVGEDITAPLQANNNQTKVLIPLTSFKSTNDLGMNQTRTLCPRDYKSPAQILVSIFEIDKNAEYKMSDGSDRPIGKINKEGKVTVPISNVHSNNKVGVTTVSTLTTTANAKILVPLEYEEYSNYWQLPRELDGKAKSTDNANGAYNRYWKTENFIGTLPSSKIQNIILPVSLKHFNDQGRIKIPHQNYSQVDTVVCETGISPTLTENHGWSQKIAKEISSDLTIEFCLKNNIAVFNIENKLYAIRHLSHIEYWRLMGWNDEDINKVQLPKSKMYYLAGNAIVISVLEAIFRELLSNKEFMRISK